ncbi:tol-pal system-associated acyl-CoA thioesterase [Parvularcula oceani]|uniref:tol-pal system-associated acyl-CoA thioesterase n=1 Tax=Parvularcula oceani TaxID=1247963 RepID=UPI00068C2873|nr:tol-pal system-associated acyl-CoA thioesterase [Parvularcula oceani]
MTHELQVRVYYEDTDFSGVVYHANYLRFFERGRTEAMRAAGGSHAEMLEADEPLAFTVRSLSMDYMRPARIDDLLTVRTTLSEVRGARMVFGQAVLRGEEVLAAGEVTVACMTMEGRPRRLPPALRRLFERTLSPPGN